jgi:hypothetical protein
MTGAALSSHHHHLGNVEGFLARREALLTDQDQRFRRQDYAVKPVDMVPAPRPCEKPHVRSDYFGFDVGNKKFRQPVTIRNRFRLLVSAHKTIPAWLLLGAFARRKSVVSEQFCTQPGICSKAHSRHNLQYFAAVKTRQLLLANCSGRGNHS